MTFFDCTADLVGQLNGNGQKGMLQIDAPPVENVWLRPLCERAFTHSQRGCRRRASDTAQCHRRQPHCASSHHRPASTPRPPAPRSASSRDRRSGAPPRRGRRPRVQLEGRPGGCSPPLADRRRLRLILRRLNLVAIRTGVFGPRRIG